MAASSKGFLKLLLDTVLQARSEQTTVRSNQEPRLRSQQLGRSPGKVNTMSENSCALSKPEAYATTLRWTEKNGQKVGLSLKHGFKSSPLDLYNENMIWLDAFTL